MKRLFLFIISAFFFSFIQSVDAQDFDAEVVRANTGEYAIYTLPQYSPLNLSAVIRNNGLVPITNVHVDFLVYDQLSTLIFQTNNSIGVSINGGNETEIFGDIPLSLTAIDQYTIDIIVSLNEIDPNPNNNQTTRFIDITPFTMGRDHLAFGDPYFPVGVGTPNPFLTGQFFTINQPATLSSVEFMLTNLQPGDLGQQVHVAVIANAGTIAGAPVCFTVNHTINNLNDQLLNLPVGGGTFLLNPGTYFFGVNNASFVGFTDFIHTPLTAGVYDPFQNQLFPVDSVPAEGAFIVRPQFCDPVADFEYVVNGLSVDFTNTSIVNSGNNLNWDFGDGNISSAQNPTHQYAVPDTYQVCLTVVDSGCGQSVLCRNVVVIGCPPVNVSINKQDVSCWGGSDGWAIATATGGLLPPFTYSWTSGATTQSAQGLSTGTYTVFATDQAGCQGFANVTILQPGDMQIPGAVTNQICIGGADGAIDISPVGGTPPYTFNWAGYTNNSTTPTFTSSSEDISGLLPGSYIVTVTDQNQCVSTAGFSVDSSNFSLQVIEEKSDTCNGSTGRLRAIPSGPITAIVWSNGASGGLTLSQLTAGNYSCTVTYGGGACTISESGTVQHLNINLNVSANANDEICDLANGSAVITVSNSSTGLFSWTLTGNNGTSDSGLSGSNSWTHNNLSSGSYTVNVTDDNGCTGSTSFFISNQPSTLSLSFTNAVEPSCNGGTNGFMFATVTGGVQPYSYNWAGSGFNGPAPNGPSLNGISAGAFFLTVTDAIGCTITGVNTIGEMSGPIAGGTTKDVDCPGGADGTITTSVSLGTPPYTYSWADGPTSSNRSGLTPGLYFLTVSDANGCVDVVQFTINEPPPFEISETITNVSPCSYSGNGMIVISVSGANPPYTYSWSNGGNSAVIGNLVAGTYSVTVTDDLQCTTSGSYTVSGPSALLATAESFNVTCNGGSDGEIGVVAAGGMPPYSYSWSNGASGPTDIGVQAGTYTVTVTDANGCTALSSTTVTEPPALQLTANITHNPCNGNSAGVIDLTVAGGVPGYTYSWSNGSAGQDIGNLPAGTYSVTVTDAAGCTADGSYTVNEPAALSISFHGTSISCNGMCNATQTASASGGTPPYQYAWSNGASGTNASGLCAGTYTVTVIDANGCLGFGTITLMDPPALEVTCTSTNSNCDQNDGTASVAVTGGTPGYSYAWSNGGNTATINVGSGTFTVTVTDAMGCTATCQTHVSDNGGVTVLISELAGINCFGQCTAVLTAGGASSTCGGPFTYAWSGPGGFASTSQQIGNLCAGTYTLTVTDACGCVTIETYVVDEPPTLEVIVATTDETCAGLNDGTATANASGGTPPYSYAWNNGGATAQIFAGGGTYTVTVTDANGCTATASGTINSGAQVMTLSAVVKDDTCFNGLGSIDLTVTGGTAPYNYAWGNGAATEDISGLITGTYGLTVTDNNGCVAIGSYTVNDNFTSFNVTMTKTNDECGGATGTATATPTGGIPPYLYIWSNSGATQTIGGLVAGLYEVTVTDAYGCTAYGSIQVNQNTSMNISTTATHVACAGGSDGSTSASASGGTPPYSYAWSNGGAGASISGLSAGTYTVTATDAMGCVITGTVMVNDGIVLDIQTNSLPVHCFGGSNGVASAWANNGTPPYTYSWALNGNVVATTEVVTGLSAGTYTVVITDANGCTASESVGVLENPQLVISTQGSSNPTCGQSNGQAIVIGSGGTPPYSYAWSNGATTNANNGIPAGFYGVTITDALGCTVSTFFLLSTAGGPTVTDITTETACETACTGTAQAFATGGTPPYLYAWSNGQNIATATGLCMGNHTVVVTDAAGCATTHQVTITAGIGFFVQLSKTDVSCFGGSDGTVTSNILGGTPPFTYAWSNGATTANLTSVPAGTYTVNVTDANGCTDDEFITVNEPDDITISGAVTNTTCWDGTDGAVDISVSGGTPPYTYSWSNGQTTQDVSGLSKGVSYSVTVTDANNCQKTASYVIGGGTVIFSTISAIHDTCGSGTGALTVTNTSGGTPPYTYSWSNGTTGTNITGLGFGWYGLTITDALGCTVSTSRNVLEVNLVLNVTINKTDALCANSDGSATAFAANGQAPYSYVWSTGAVTQSIFSLAPGTYSVTVSDARGCTGTASVEILRDEGNIQTNLSIVTWASCGSNNGVITCNPTGGTPPYNYIWYSPGWTGLQHTQTISNLNGGWYRVTVTDQNGCTAVNSVIMNTSGTMFVIGTATNVACNGASTGSISLSVGGGNPPYTYNWSDGATVKDRTGLPAGTYYVEVHDQDGCTKVEFVDIDEPNPLEITAFTVQNAACTYSADGNIYTSVSGGVSPYTYQWSNGATSTSIHGLPVGTYSVTVTDQLGCTTTQSGQVGSPNPVSATANITHVSCFGGNDGSISATGTGGSGNYSSYSWSNGGFGPVISNLTAGTYTVTVTDHLSCSGTASFTVNEPAQISILSILTHPMCFGGTGTIDIAAGGGTPPYTYAWSNFSTSEDQVGVPAGSYSVTVTDANDCTHTGSWVLTQPTQVTVSTTTTPASTLTSTDGSATATAAGGTPGYTYAWSNGVAGPTISNVTAGTYTVTATDANGCTAVATAFVGVQFACATPGNLGTANIKPFSAVLTWDTVGNASRYIIRGGAVGSGNVITITIPNPATSNKPIFGLSYQTQYWWQIQSDCGQGATSLWSTIDTFETTCAVPSPISTSNVTSSSAILNWSTTPGAAGYEIQGRRVGTSSWVSLTVGNANTFKSVGGLSANTSYEWKVRAWCDVNGVKKSAWSETIQFTTSSVSSRLSDENEVSDFSFEKQSEELRFSISPNPARDRIKVDVKGLNADNDYQVKIYNMAGAQVFSGRFNQEGETLDLYDLKNGIYTVTVEQDGNFVSKRLVMAR